MISRKLFLLPIISICIASAYFSHAQEDLSLSCASSETTEFKPNVHHPNLPQELTKGQKFAFITPEAKAIKSPDKFAPRGDCGLVMSELFPQLATVADELTMIRSMKTNKINHGSGELFFHTGHGCLGRPTFGAWTSYGLGTENENLPAYWVTFSMRK